LPKPYYEDIEVILLGCDPSIGWERRGIRLCFNCDNYFKTVTFKNKMWVEIASLWMSTLREELVTI